MIFACRIKDGHVNFSNRYVQTNRLQQEKAAGHVLGLKVRNHITNLISAKSRSAQQQEMPQLHGRISVVSCKHNQHKRVHWISCSRYTHNCHAASLHVVTDSVIDVQIGDLRGLGGLLLLMWHELEMKLGVYSAKVTSCTIRICTSFTLHQHRWPFMTGFDCLRLKLCPIALHVTSKPHLSCTS